MERERLTELLNDPSQVGREDLAGLRDLTARNPWFTAGHLLMATGEHAQGDVHYDSSLQTAAAHLPVRSVLFDVIHGDRPVSAPLRILPKDPAPGPGPLNTDPEPIDAVPTEPAQEQAPTFPAEEVAEPIVDVLDDEIRRSALASSYELLMEHTPEQVLPSTPASGTGFGSEAEDLERNVLHEEAVPIPEPQVNSEITTDAPAAAEPISGATRVLSGGRMRFTEWLEVSSGKVEVESIEAPRLAESGPSPSIEAEPGFPGGTVDSKALIDQFIQQTLPAPRPKTEFYTPQQAAKRSLDDTAGMVTETLARIYAKQGNTAKAVEAYRKLALKYPDKSAYFAALSKALEEH